MAEADKVKLKRTLDVVTSSIENLHEIAGHILALTKKNERKLPATHKQEIRELHLASVATLLHCIKLRGMLDL